MDAGEISGPLAPGTRLGPYVVGTLLGAGGVGRVYRARDSRLDRDVALHVLHAHGAEFPEFEHEAKAVAALSHPNVVAIHDYGEAQGHRYLVSELLEGRTLREVLGAGPLPARRAIETALQIAHGLAAAHDKGILHLDLKPENVLITRDGRVKVLDLGVTRATATGADLGALGYRSPEQLSDEAVTAASDIFSFGAVFYEMLSGERAFAGESEAARRRAVLSEDPPPLSSTTSGMTSGLRQIVRRCLEKRPEERFQSARDVAFAIEAIANHGAVPAPEARPATRRGLRAIGTLAAALALLLAGGIIGQTLGSRSPPPTPQALPAVMLRTLTTSGRDTSPATSSDGRLIAFRSDRDGRGRIWLRQTASGDEGALTSGPDDFPRFSPDGASILFTRTHGSRFSLFRVPILGGEPRLVVDDASDADFSPDGETIAFIRWGPTTTQPQARLMVATADGSGAREVAKLDNRWRACPRFSPDGAHVAVTGPGQQPGTPSSVEIVPVAGGEPRRVPAASAVGYLSCVAWMSPHRIAYVQGESWVQNNPARIVDHDLATGVARYVPSSPSPSSTLDVIGESALLFEAWSAPLNLREARIGGTRRGRWLTRGMGVNRQPVYSPDGAWIVFSSNQGGNLDLWAVSPSSGAIRRLTDHPAEDWDPAFAPDGQLLWSSRRTGNFEVWRAAGDGSGAAQVTNDGVSAENPSATPDGWVVYASAHPSHAGVWKVRFDGSRATYLVRGGALPEASPDGRYVVYQTFLSPGRMEVGVLRIEDGAKVFEIIIDGRASTLSESLGRPRWMPDGRQIAFLGLSAGRHGVFVQDFVPGRDTRATRRALGGLDGDEATESFGISPDATRLVLARWAKNHSLMIATGVAGIGLSHSP
jgi:serine/threonine protein kinase